MAKGKNVSKKIQAEVPADTDISKEELSGEDDTSDVDIISKAIGVILIVINIAWLVVIAPAVWNTLYPKF